MKLFKQCTESMHHLYVLFFIVTPDIVRLAHISGSSNQHEPFA